MQAYGRLDPQMKEQRQLSAQGMDESVTALKWCLAVGKRQIRPLTRKMCRYVQLHQGKGVSGGHQLAQGWFSYCRQPNLSHFCGLYELLCLTSEKVCDIPGQYQYTVSMASLIASMSTTQSADCKLTVFLSKLVCHALILVITECSFPLR